MLFLKAFSCMVICFGLGQTKCIQNVLLEKVLQSNKSNTEKLEEVNEIVLNGHSEELKLDAIQEQDVPLSLDLSFDSAPTQLPAIPPSYLWNPLTSFGRPKSKTYYNRRPPPMSYTPWGAAGMRTGNSEQIQYQQSSFNPYDGSQFNSYQEYQPPSKLYNPNLMDKIIPPLLNVPSAIYNDRRSELYDPHPTAGLESQYPAQYPQHGDHITSQGNQPSLLDGYISEYMSKHPMNNQQ